MGPGRCLDQTDSLSEGRKRKPEDPAVARQRPSGNAPLLGLPSVIYLEPGPRHQFSLASSSLGLVPSPARHEPGLAARRHSICGPAIWWEVATSSPFPPDMASPWGAGPLPGELACTGGCRGPGPGWHRAQLLECSVPLWAAGGLCIQKGRLDYL